MLGEVWAECTAQDGVCGNDRWETVDLEDEDKAV